MGFGMAGAAYQSCARECGLVCEFKRLKTHETKCHLVSCALSLLMAHTGRAILLRTRSVQNMYYIKQKTGLTRNENIGQSFGVMVFCLAGLYRKRPVVTDLKHLLRWEGLHIRQFDVSMAWTACDH